MTLLRQIQMGHTGETQASYTAPVKKSKQTERKHVTTFTQPSYWNGICNFLVKESIEISSKSVIW